MWAVRGLGVSARGGAALRSRSAQQQLQCCKMARPALSTLSPPTTAQSQSQSQSQSHSQSYLQSYPSSASPSSASSASYFSTCCTSSSSSAAAFWRVAHHHHQQQRSGSGSGSPWSSLLARRWFGGKGKGKGKAGKGKAGKGKMKAKDAVGGRVGDGNDAAPVDVNKAGYGIEGDILFRIEGLRKTLPGNRIILDDVTLGFLRGAKIGVLGLNGSGKSTLMKIIAGDEKDYDGTVWVKDGVKVGYLPQEPQLDPEKDVHGNIMDGLKDKTDLLERFYELSAEMANPDADFDALLEEQGELQTQIDFLDCWSLDHVVKQASTALRCPPGDTAVTGLSGGERRRIALCRLLLEAPDVLLLDEPTNHLDAESVGWLEDFLMSYQGTVVAVTHDRYFLDNVAAWILEMDRGHAFVYQGNYSTWLSERQKRMNLEKKHEAARAKAMQAELNWIRRGAKGQQAKGKARVKAFDAKQDADATQSAARRFLSGRIGIPPGPRLGNVGVELQGVSLSIGGRELIKDLSFAVGAGHVVGVVGPNGAGKSTLLGVIDGTLAPDAGAVKLGSTVRMGHVAQSRDDLDDTRAVYDAVSEGSEFVMVGDREVPVRSYMASFNLTGAVQQKQVGLLSGGERCRVHLARTLKRSPNVLLLDEPTNDLDVETLRSLEEALEEFDGLAIVVSHDRYFLDRSCTHTVAYEGDGEVVFFEGNYSQYEEWKKANKRAAQQAEAAAAK